MGTHDQSTTDLLGRRSTSRRTRSRGGRTAPTPTVPSSARSGDATAASESSADATAVSESSAGATAVSVSSAGATALSESSADATAVSGSSSDAPAVPESFGVPQTVRSNRVGARTKSDRRDPASDRWRRPSFGITARRSGAEREGGVAPALRPPSRFQQWRMRRSWAPRGFVPMSPGREKRRHRILPRTVIGTSFMLLSFASGIGFAGAAFYAYYDDRLAQSEQQTAAFIEGFHGQFDDASSALEQMRNDAIAEVRAELGPMAEFASDARGVIELPGMVGESVWVLESLDDAGRPVIGSAFAAAGHDGGTAFLTSYSLVRASTTEPRPSIWLLKGDQRVEATLWSWDPTHDLALITTTVPVTPMTLADPAVHAQSLGGRGFVMAGVGGQGATASPGVIVDRAERLIQHTAPVGTFFVGGPLVDGEGVVLGVGSLSYRPLGVDSGVVAQSPDIAAICAKVLNCDDITTGRAPSVGEPSD